MNNPFTTADISLVVSVRTLNEALKSISTQQDFWWIIKNTSQSVTVGYRNSYDHPGMDLRLSMIAFKFPKIVTYPLLSPRGMDDIVCLYPASRVAVQKGLYWENEELKNDEVRDWITFWPPIKIALEIVLDKLYKLYSEGGSTTSSIKDSSSAGVRSKI
jgi:hypothetical protein